MDLEGEGEIKKEFPPSPTLSHPNPVVGCIGETADLVAVHDENGGGRGGESRKLIRKFDGEKYDATKLRVSPS